MAGLVNRVVLITGASSGIGQAAALAFAQRGARLSLAARRVERLEALTARLRASGTEVLSVPTDISRLADIEHWVNETQNRFGQVDVLVNNAGLGRLDFLDRLDSGTDVTRQIEVNVLGAMHTTRQVLPLMLAQRNGRIINVASVAGLVAPPTYAVYAASKFAIRGFSEALRRETTPWGVQVSVIYPGAVTATEFSAAAGIHRKTGATTPRWLQLTAGQVADRVVRLAAAPQMPAMVVVPGWYQAIYWLNLIWPGLVDWLVIRQFTLPERRDELPPPGRR